MIPATILVVHAHSRTRGRLRATLEQEGYRVHEAVDGQTALSFMEHGAIDLILLNARLPDMDLTELVMRLRSLPNGSAVSILAISAPFGSGDDPALVAVDLTDYLAGPVHPARLVEAVRLHLPARARCDE